MKIIRYFRLRLITSFVLTIFLNLFCTGQTVGKVSKHKFQNKIFVKTGVSSDNDLYPAIGYHYSAGYGRYIWKGFNLNISYSHCQTNTLKGSFKYDTYPYGNIYRDRNYIDKYIGISQSDYLNEGTVNGLNVHDAFFLKGGYDFNLGKKLFISPFFGIAYSWSKFTRVFVDSANFVNDKLVGGNTGFSYEQGKVFGPHLGFDLGYTFKNKKLQLFIEPELVILTTPGNPRVVSAYEAVQFSFGYNYKF